MSKEGVGTTFQIDISTKAQKNPPPGIEEEKESAQDDSDSD